jgi:hypothetical protein
LASGGGSAAAMPTIAVGLAPPTIVAAAKLVTTVWPSPVTAGPAAAAGIAVPLRSLPEAVNALSAAASTAMTVAMMVDGKTGLPASMNWNATSITRILSRWMAVEAEPTATFTAPIVGWIRSPGPLVSTALSSRSCMTGARSPIR